MKAKLSVFVFLLSVLFFSCGNILNQKGQGSVTIDVDKVARYIANNARNASTDSKILTIKLSTIGDYSASAEENFTITNDEIFGTNKELTLEGIPVGSHIKVKAEVTLESSKAEGYSEEFVVKDGPNRVIIKIEDSILDCLGVETSIVLYTNTGNSQGMYKFNKKLIGSNEVLEPEKTFAQGFSVQDFVIDKSSNVYYTDGRNLYCEAYDNPLLTSIDDLSANNIKLYIDDSGLLFYGGDSSNGTFSLCAYDKGYGVNATVNSNLSIPGIHWFDFAVKLTSSNAQEEENIKRTTYCGYLYLAGQENGNSGLAIKFFRIPVTYDAISYENGSSYEETISLDDSSITSISIADGAPSFAATMTSYAKITDMLVQNDNLYALYREQYIDKIDYFHPDIGPQYAPDGWDTYSRGALVKINKSFNSLQLLGDSEIFTSQSLFTYEDDVTLYGNFYQAKNNFFGPQKFIAIKPKKLVIADDGLFFYKDDDDCKYKNINQVIIVEEKTNTSTSYTLNTSQVITFNSEENTDIAFELQCGSPSYEGTPATFTKVD